MTAQEGEEAGPVTTEKVAQRDGTRKCVRDRETRNRGQRFSEMDREKVGRQRYPDTEKEMRTEAER